MNRDKECGKIKLKCIDGPNATLADFANLILKALEGSMGALSFTARETRLTKFWFPDGFKLRYDQMVDDSVSVLGCEDFARLWMRHDKAGRFRRKVFSLVDLPAKINQVLAKPELKTRLLMACRFSHPATFVGSQEV